jgi:hypothetical protein
MTAARLGLDYFQVYDLATKPADAVVQVKGQFDSRRVTMRLSVLEYFATPVSKNGEPLHDRHAHLAWYTGVDPPQPIRQVILKNQLGTFKVCTGAGYGLLVPTQKIEQGSRYPDTLDHYKVYRLTDVETIQKTSLDLRDQFGASRLRLLAPVHLAVPVEKRHDADAFPIRNEVAHLLIFAVKTLDVEDRPKVSIWNQFDKRKSLDLLRAVMLAVPCVKGEWKPRSNKVRSKVSNG